MNTKAKIGFIASGVLAAAGITLMAAQPKNQMTYEQDLLNGAAAYVEQYDGNKPADALQYLLQTIDAAEESGKVQGLSKLEKDVSEIMDEVVFLGGYRNPPTLYHAALEEASEQTKAVVHENTPSKAYIAFSLISWTLGCLAGSFGVINLRKKKTP